MPFFLSVCVLWYGIIVIPARRFHKWLLLKKIHVVEIDVKLMASCVMDHIVFKQLRKLF